MASPTSPEPGELGPNGNNNLISDADEKDFVDNLIDLNETLRERMNQKEIEWDELKKKLEKENSDFRTEIETLRTEIHVYGQMETEKKNLIEEIARLKNQLESEKQTNVMNEQLNGSLKKTNEGLNADIDRLNKQIQNLEIENDSLRYNREELDSLRSFTSEMNNLLFI